MFLNPVCRLIADSYNGPRVGEGQAPRNARFTGLSAVSSLMTALKDAFADIVNNNVILMFLALGYAGPAENGTERTTTMAEGAD